MKKFVLPLLILFLIPPPEIGAAKPKFNFYNAVLKVSDLPKEDIGRIIPKGKEVRGGTVIDLYPDRTKQDGKCSPDCDCEEGHCTCKYSGECLVNKYGGGKSSVVVNRCWSESIAQGRPLCETRTYHPEGMKFRTPGYVVLNYKDDKFLEAELVTSDGRHFKNWTPPAKTTIHKTSLKGFGAMYQPDREDPAPAPPPQAQAAPQPHYAYAPPATAYGGCNGCAENSGSCAAYSTMRASGCSGSYGADGCSGSYGARPRIFQRWRERRANRRASMGCAGAAGCSGSYGDCSGFSGCSGMTAIVNRRFSGCEG